MLSWRFNRSFRSSFMIDVITHMMQFRYDIPVELVISVLSRVDIVPPKPFLFSLIMNYSHFLLFQNIILHLFGIDACLFTARDNFPSVKFKFKNNPIRFFLKAWYGWKFGKISLIKKVTCIFFEDSASSGLKEIWLTIRHDLVVTYYARAIALDWASDR